LPPIVAVDAFTADNGGTEVIPGSHLWGDAAVAGVLRDILGTDTALRARLKQQARKAGARLPE
jgi:ectoine hydroxylase-related dioxygenase (phytanoyl-CoA dioxygenase family)